MRVALVVMPFFTADCPSLAAGLLKSALRRKGIACDVKYFTLEMVDLLGYETYRTLSVDFPSSVLAGEWAFSQLYYGTAHSDWDAYERDVLEHPLWGLDPSRRHLVRKAQECAPRFLDTVWASTDWSQYDLVGFSSTFEQTMPSMCLARRIRENSPQTTLAAGGANFEGPMGLGLMKQFHFLDYVCTGEGDDSFPELCERIAKGNFDPPKGFLHRQGEMIVGDLTRPASVDMESLPIPDYVDYFEQFRSRRGRIPQPWIPAETSRGCWWGQRNHCTFCGLNGDGMAFRSKSWQKVAEEIDELDERYHPASFQFADNILGMPYFKDLLPHWAARGQTTPKFFELKSNLSREQVRLLDAADVRCVQAGVESLSDHTLSVMKKGVTGAQNVALLRWCRESDITTNWNVLFGFPKARAEDLPMTWAVVQKLTHLDPPALCGLIRTDRFSPNFSRWQEEGFSSIRPMPAYAHVFPASAEELWEVAYFFDSSHDGLQATLDASRPLVEFCASWKEVHARDECGVLEIKRHLSGGFVLIDSRFNMTKGARVLSRAECAIALAGDAPVASEKLVHRAESLAPDVPREELERALVQMLERSEIAQIGIRALTLALIPDELRASFSVDSPLPVSA